MASRPHPHNQQLYVGGVGRSAGESAEEVSWKWWVQLNYRVEGSVGKMRVEVGNNQRGEVGENGRSEGR